MYKINKIVYEDFTIELDKEAELETRMETVEEIIKSLQPHLDKKHQEFLPSSKATMEKSKGCIQTELFLDRLANYLIYADDKKDGLRKNPKHVVSLDGILNKTRTDGQPIGDSFKLHPIDRHFRRGQSYFRRGEKPIDRNDPRIQNKMLISIWKEIDWLKEKIKTVDKESKTYRSIQRSIYTLHSMQYRIRDSIVQPILSEQRVNDSTIDVNTNFEINSKTVLALIQHYHRIKVIIDMTPGHDFTDLIEAFEEAILNIPWRLSHKIVLKGRLNHQKRSKIQEELNKVYSFSYSVPYISRILHNQICEPIAAYMEEKLKYGERI